MAKERLDVVMTQRGLAESRQKAQAIIMSGQVYVNDQKQTKADELNDFYNMAAQFGAVR